MWVPTERDLFVHGGGRGAGTILAFRGVSTTNPVVTSNNQLNASSTTRTAPSVTPGTPSTMLLALYTVANGTTDTLSNPSGMTQDVDVSTQFGSSGLLIGAFYKLLGASTATGTLVSNSSGGISAVSIGTTIALLPAVGTPRASGISMKAPGPARPERSSIRAATATGAPPSTARPRRASLLQSRAPPAPAGMGRSTARPNMCRCRAPCRTPAVPSP